MIRARIVGTGHYMPDRLVTNAELEKLTDTSDEWIRQRTGILQRYFSEPESGASALAVPASQKALQSAGIGPGDLDLIICATTTPDYVFPATACVVQEALGITNTPAFDLNAACSGFMYGLSTANAFIRSGTYKTILVVASEIVSNRISFKKRDTAVLFGDGAGAVVMKAEEGDHGVLTTHLWADGGGREILWLPIGGSKTPTTPENYADDGTTIQMKGKELFKRAVVEFGDAIEVALKAANVDLSEISLFVPHQANVRILQSVAERLGMPQEKVIINLDRVANTVAASIPIALSECVEQGRIKSGDMILLASFGAGLTWGSAVVRW
ncbi:MAG: 3-oxoacyl-[acyl-carrier-protein] synthase 3 [Candidatus Hydrogenedentota bacterium]